MCVHLTFDPSCLTAVQFLVATFTNSAAVVYTFTHYVWHFYNQEDQNLGLSGLEVIVFLQQI